LKYHPISKSFSPERSSTEGASGVQIQRPRQFRVLAFQTMAKLLVQKFCICVAEQTRVLGCKVERRWGGVLGVTLNRKPHLIPYSTAPY